MTIAPSPTRRRRRTHRRSLSPTVLVSPLWRTSCRSSRSGRRTARSTLRRTLTTPSIQPAASMGSMQPWSSLMSSAMLLLLTWPKPSLSASSWTRQTQKIRPVLVSSLTSGLRPQNSTQSAVRTSALLTEQPPLSYAHRADKFGWTPSGHLRRVLVVDLQRLSWYSSLRICTESPCE